MKANELMIGDILKWKEQPGFNDEDRNMVLRVKNIFEDAIKIDGRFELYNISLFEPIPLTPEILEKNGWKSYSHENTPIFGTIQGFEIVLEWMDYYWQLCVDGTVYRKIKIRYVNELQHALRLCGIEKKYASL